MNINALTSKNMFNYAHTETHTKQNAFVKVHQHPPTIAIINEATATLGRISTGAAS